MVDVVIFMLNEQHYALPAIRVTEVLDPLPVTPLPFAPPHVDGLVNVAGQVAVQLDAGLRLGSAVPLAPEQGSVLVVEAGGAPCALHVEKVLSRATVADADLALAEAAAGSAEGVPRPGAAVKGEFPWNGQPVLLLDADAFSLDGIAAEGVPQDGGGLLGTAAAATDVDARPPAEEFACLVVACRGERYAFPLGEVREVVEVGRLTGLPHAPAEVRGMALLRGVPLLALSLGVMLGGAHDAAEPAMVVVEICGQRIGLLAEKVLGIERFNKDALQAADHGQEIDGYLVGRGDTMIGLLRLAGLVDETRFAACRSFLVVQRPQDAARHAGSGTTTRMLAFRVGTEHCALPLACVERVEECSPPTAVPEGDAGALAGVVQIQGEVAPVVDLGRAMGAGAGHAGAFLVVRMDGSPWALAVDKVERVVELAQADIEPVRRAAGDYIEAIGRLGGRLVSVLTLEPLRETA